MVRGSRINPLLIRRKVLVQCTVLNDPYKHATSPILFCTINSVFSAIISGKLFLSVNITSESCLHEKSPVVFKILALSRALLGAGPGRAVAPHHGDRDTHTHQPPPSMAIMLQNKPPHTRHPLQTCKQCLIICICRHVSNV